MTGSLPNVNGYSLSMAVRMLTVDPTANGTVVAGRKWHRGRSLVLSPPLTGI